MSLTSCRISSYVYIYVTIFSHGIKDISSHSDISIGNSYYHAEHYI